MELITWEQATNHLYPLMIHLKMMMINLKIAILGFDLYYYAIYIAAYFLGRKLKITTISLQNLLPLIMALFMCQLVFSILVLPFSEYPVQAVKEKKASLIFFLFYLQCVVYFVKCKNLWVSLSCSLMCAYMLVRMEFWKYVEIYGKAPSQLLYDAHWLVILLLHCFIASSFFLEHRYSGAYKRLLIRFWRD